MTQRAKEPDDGHAVAVLQVRPTSAVALPTRRLSFAFEFELVRVGADAEGMVEELDVVRDGAVRVRVFQGADRQPKDDSATRVLELLDAAPQDVDPEDRSRGRPYAIPDVGDLRLTILRRRAPLETLWILERADGRRAVFAPHRNS